VLFRDRQCRGDLLRNVNGSADIERPRAANPLIKGLALDQFHRVKILACLLANSEFVDGGDVLVSQRGGRAGFAYKTFMRLDTSFNEVDFNDLKRDFAPESLVSSQIDVAHSASTDE